MDPSEPETDGGQDVGLDEQLQYEIVRTAVEDALLSVLGTLVLLAIALGAVAVGAILASGQTTIDIVIGGIVVAFALVLAGAALDLFPSLRNGE